MFVLNCVFNEGSVLSSFFYDVLTALGLLPEEKTVSGRNLSNYLSADEFQIKILQFLLIILILNVTAIYFAWKHYGPRIAERFMKPVSLKVLEELKTGATELKLPTEHSPRI